MAGKDIIEMRLKELKRLKLVHRSIDGQITQKTAAEMVGLCERQIRRIVKAVREDGDAGVVHRGRGRPSNRRVSDKVKKKVVRLYKKKYLGFGPTLASEKLQEMDGIKLSDETLRLWLLEAGLWKKKRKISRHRRWRPRKECLGEMVQMDGSHHDWLEGRGPELVLMGWIDDATNNVYARFYDYEGTIPAMDSFKRYARKYGLPVSIYLDRHTTYKSSKKLTQEEILEGMKQSLSQFERALSDLGVNVIHAYSPQAKGRIERLFGVFQDRLVKEMRLEGIKTKAEANEFLKGYLPKYNKRFRVVPVNKTNVHVKLPTRFDLDKHLCIKTRRVLRNDNTVAHNGKLYQVKERINGKKVVIQERLNGSLKIIRGETNLRYREITERPKKESAAQGAPRAPLAERKPSTPPKDHPWRRWQTRKPLPERRAVAH